MHALERHVLIPHERIKVTVSDGWLTLEGNVNWQFEKKLAESAVKKLEGVLGVTNKIDVRPKLSVSQISQKIEEALRRSAELDARRITVDIADDGTVKLYGSVRSWAEKVEAERAAWSAPGAKAIENHIAVQP